MADCKINYKGQEFNTTEEVETFINERSKNRRFGKKVTKTEDEVPKTTDTRYEEIINRISNMYEKFKPRTIETNAIEESMRAAGKETKLLKLEKLIANLEELTKESTLAGMLQYSDYAQRELDILSEEIEEAILKDEVTPELIKKIKDHVAVFDLITYVKESVIEEADKGVIDETQKTQILDQLSGISGKHDDLLARISVLRQADYARIMSKHSNQAEQDWREKFAKEHEMFAPNEPKLEWINKKMEENKAEINKESYDAYVEQAKASHADISNFASWLYTEKNLKSEEIQVASKIIDNADLTVDKYITTKASRFKNAYDGFNSDKKGTFAPEKKYERFIDESGDTQYLMGKYKSEFAETQAQLRRDMNDPDVYNEKFKDVKTTINTYEIGGKLFTFKRKGGSEFRVEGEFLTYKAYGVQRSEPIKSAIARSEYKRWILSNTQRETPKSKNFIPKDKWLNPKYDALSDKDKADLQFLRSSAVESHGLYGFEGGLVNKLSGQNFIKIPSVTKTTIERLKGGKVKSAAIDLVVDAFKKKADDEDLGTEDQERIKDAVKVMADINNKEELKVRVPFRGKLDKSEQSFDLHTIFLMDARAAKNFSEKKAIEMDIVAISDVMADRLIPNRAGMRKVKKLHAFSGKQLFLPDDQVPNDLKALYSIMENRLYGIRQKSSGAEGKVSAQKTVGTALKIASAVALVGNYANSIVNATTGTVNNIIEAIGGDVYTLSDWRKGKKKYVMDMPDMAKDIGANVDTSKTNLYLKIFNVLGSRQYLNSNFENNNWIYNAAKENFARPLATMGEHMMQAQVMYAVMTAIKVTNLKGEYLDVNGKVVKSKKDAASFDDVIIFKKDPSGAVQMIMKPWVKATSFSPNPTGQNQILLETRNLIKKKIIDLHGNYDTDLQSAAQREWWGKMLFFLRKWMEPTLNRRWRGMNTVAKSSAELEAADRFYSQDLKQYQEGYYATAVRLVYQIIKGAREMQFAAIGQEWNKLSRTERSNMRKFGAELGLITLTVLAYALIGGFDEDPEEDTLMARYLLRREISELTFYMNPAETYKIASTPSASVTYIKKMMDLIEQSTIGPFETYDTGVNKKRSKVWVKTLKMMPFIGNTLEADFDSKLRFLQNSR